MATATATKPRKTKTPQTFRIRFEIGTDVYAVIPLAPDAGVASKAFRFRKLTGNLTVSDVHVNEHGPVCDCKGHQRWNRCKHVRTLKAAGMA